MNIVKGKVAVPKMHPYSLDTDNGWAVPRERLGVAIFRKWMLTKYGFSFGGFYARF